MHVNGGRRKRNILRLLAAAAIGAWVAAGGITSGTTGGTHSVHRTADSGWDFVNPLA